MKHNICKQLSLQRIAEVKIMAELWNQDDIQTEIAKINFQSFNPIAIHPYYFYKEKKRLENQSLEMNITEKVSALPIPELFKKNLATLINPLGFEIKSWWCYHNNLELKTPIKLRWTPRGIVDYKKTAELIVNDENEDVETRYKMTCLYCFEKDIHILWKHIPKTRKEVLYYRYFEFAVPIVPWAPQDGGDYREHIVAFWTYIVSNRVTKLHDLPLKTGEFDIFSSYQFAFEWATLGLNPSAAEFFFAKLSCEEKSKSLIIYALYWEDSPKYFSLARSCKMEMLFFLLNQMSEEQQEMVFKWNSYIILRDMLRWPYQPLFIETAKKWSHCLPVEDYCNLLFKIGDVIKNDKKDYGYGQLLEEFGQFGLANYPTNF